ncbi:hypothetical protein [Sphingomonas sp. R86520]|uniref:hypothetical protein n=1 Tax=Sphingomonas sp. R86520 TaxID=3093859 RepID=UPI0036D3375F
MLDAHEERGLTTFAQSQRRLPDLFGLACTSFGEKDDTMLRLQLFPTGGTAPEHPVHPDVIGALGFGLEIVEGPVERDEVGAGSDDHGVL